MLTHYGDLDHDVIDEMPPGRLAAKTYFGKNNRLTQIFEFIRLALKESDKRMLFIHLIEESEHLDSLLQQLMGLSNFKSFS